jgi:hypothetical protein
LSVGIQGADDNQRAGKTIGQNDKIAMNTKLTVNEALTVRKASNTVSHCLDLICRSTKWITRALVLTPLSALAGGAGFGQLRTALSSSLGLIMMIAFLMGVIAIINGGMSIWRGDTAQGKMSLIAGIVIAGASVIIGAIFQFMNLAPNLTPTFN